MLCLVCCLALSCSGIRWFDFQCTKFVFDLKTSAFSPVQESCRTWSFKTLQEMGSTGLSAGLTTPGGIFFVLTFPSSAQYLDQHFTVSEGKNVIEVKITPVHTARMASSHLCCANPLSVLVELFGPVYIYQYFCCALWFYHDYFIFASIIFARYKYQPVPSPSKHLSRPSSF